MFAFASHQFRKCQFASFNPKKSLFSNFSSNMRFLHHSVLVPHQFRFISHIFSKTQGNRVSQPFTRDIHFSSASLPEEGENLSSQMVLASQKYSSVSSFAFRFALLNKRASLVTIKEK